MVWQYDVEGQMELPDMNAGNLEIIAGPCQFLPAMWMSQDMLNLDGGTLPGYCLITSLEAN